MVETGVLIENANFENLKFSKSLESQFFKYFILNFSVSLKFPKWKNEPFFELRELNLRFTYCVKNLNHEFLIRKATIKSNNE